MRTLASSVLAGLYLASVCTASGASPPVGRPAGVSLVETQPGTFTALSNPFDGSSSVWLEGASAFFVWDADQQEWTAMEKGEDGKYVDAQGNRLVEKSGTSMVVGGPNNAAGQVVMTGLVPVEDARVVSLEEGLTLQGNPFGALTNEPLDTDWYRSGIQGTSTLLFENPAKAVFTQQPGTPGIEPVGRVEDGKMTFRVTPGAYADTPMILLTREIRGGTTGPVTAGWMQRAVVAAPEDGLDWVLPMPQGDAEDGMVLLVVATPQVDRDRDGVPDGVEALVLGSDWETPPGASEEADTETSLGTVAGGMNEEARLRQLIEMGGRRVHPPAPAFTVNDPQERTVGEHARRGQALRRLGLSNVSQLTPVQAVAVEQETKSGRGL